MNKRFHQGDIVHIEAHVEADAHDNANLIIRSGGTEQRVRVAKSLVRHHENGPVRAGHTVYKKVKTGKIEGVVQHRVGDLCWVQWGDDAHSVEPAGNLSR